MQTNKRINFDKEYGILIFLELKTSTIRLEKKAEKGDTVILTLNEKNFAEARVTDVISLKISEITEHVAHEDGFLSVRTLKKTLKKYYPEITDETTVYQIKFLVQRFLDISLIEKDIARLCKIAISQENISTNERKLLSSVLNEGSENMSENTLENVKKILKKIYLDLIS